MHSFYLLSYLHAVIMKTLSINIHTIAEAAAPELPWFSCTDSWTVAKVFNKEVLWLIQYVSTLAFVVLAWNKQCVHHRHTFWVNSHLSIFFELEAQTLAIQPSVPGMIKTASLGSTAWYPAVPKQYCWLHVTQFICWKSWPQGLLSWIPFELMQDRSTLEQPIVTKMAGNSCH